jgi:hypothetical protein
MSHSAFEWTRREPRSTSTATTSGNNTSEPQRNHATSQINIFRVLQGKGIVTNQLRIKQSLVLLSTMLILVAACTSSESADSTTSTSTSELPTTTEAAPTTTQAVTATTQAAHDQELTDKAWAAVVTFFSATNSGNDDAVFGLFALNVVISDNFIGEWELDEWEMLQAWNTAQGTVMTPPTCSVTDEVAGESVTIRCSTGVHDAPSLAVNGPPVPTNLRAEVTTEGISKLTYGYGDPNFGEVGGPFEDWVVANHPDEAQLIGFGNWTTIEEATANGVLTAEYSAEWATYLDANDCAYNEGC